ncbi:MAG: acyltransferase [Proteobacteria bacterium]|nr:acyltransferase [Pseudomonadota bacterium]
MADSKGAPNLTRGGALDALRFAAAAFIMLYHFGLEEAPRALGEIHPVFGRGFLATDFFLMLSGYILARTYGPRLAAGRLDAGGFLLRRLVRIWPAHLLVLGGFVAVVLAAGVAGVAFNNPLSFSWDRLLRQALFIHAWGFGSDPGWNSATWTLSALVVCYALFPLLWRALSAVPPWAGLVLGVSGLAVADLIARTSGADLYTLSPAIGLGRGLPLFLLGAATARFGMARPPARLAAWLLGLGGVAALVVSQTAPGWGLVSMLGLAAVILAAGTHAPHRPSKIVAEAAVISFALFITHNLVGLVWFKAFGLLPITLSEPAAWAVWAGIFPASLLASLAFHYWMDMPIQAWLKPRLARTGPAPSVSSARPLVHPA